MRLQSWVSRRGQDPWGPAAVFLGSDACSPSGRIFASPMLQLVMQPCFTYAAVIQPCFSYACSSELSHRVEDKHKRP